ncbi:DNA-directed RNA polymerase sigma-70 factor [Bacteroidia bacterium]|nr:DNA-directed RNA polymerase sigma-70 factor [Bacteroidia bacterium]
MSVFQSELYEQHCRRIYGICLRIIGNREDAEETMHDVFLKIFDRWNELQDKQAFVAWSRSIALRTAIDHIRKNKIVFESIDNLSIVEDDEDLYDLPELTVEDVKTALNALPEGYRIVVSMRLIEQCEFSEIADLLQIKETSVRSQYIRGKEKLAKNLKQKYNNI